MSRTRVKVCGIARPGDAERAVALGADAVGMVFVRRSPRRVDLAAAVEIVEAVQGTALRVGLFMDPDPADVEDLLDRVALDVLQFHGSEPPLLCGSFRRPYIKALSVDALSDADWAVPYAGARAFIIDANRPGGPGGTGRTFDWARFPGESPRPVLLAGGLDPDNVGAAIRAVRPWGVDVSSGLEAEPGVKDPVRMERFFEEVRKADEPG